MKKSLSSLLTALLLVVFVANCNSGNPLIDEAEKYIFTNNFDQAQELLDQAIMENPESGVPHYYKALTYSQQATTVRPPSNRLPIYEKMVEQAETAKDKFQNMEDKPDEAEQINDLVYDAWAREHNAAINYATGDSATVANVEEPLKFAIDHLVNAVTINPDSTLSRDVLAQVYWMDNQPEQAIEAKKAANELKEPVPSIDYDILASYQIQQGRYEEALITLESAIELYPDSVSLVQKTADAYMQTGQREKSISTIQSLIDKEPENAQYHLALGTQLLQVSSRYSDSLANNSERLFDLEQELRGASGSEEEQIQSRIDEIEEDNAELQRIVDDLVSRAESALMNSLDIEPNQEAAYNALGILYQNKAAALYDLRNNTLDNEKADEYDKRAEDNLRKAMEYYEKAVEFNPDDLGYWEVLSRIYVQLGMNEKAEEAMEKAGM